MRRPARRGLESWRALLLVQEDGHVGGKSTFLKACDYKVGTCARWLWPRSAVTLFYTMEYVLGMLETNNSITIRHDGRCTFSYLVLNINSSVHEFPSQLQKGQDARNTLISSFRPAHIFFSPTTTTCFSLALSSAVVP